ncbi:type II restriction/modification system DNA methylase subunit YeeA [Breznakibacter xylanolyticus]|uniref:site-specific DNA-methyltransferase (adenine-specific) n=1 Tax=Breznakibacter xylanolyticus TaxID=990 RepID=A0A2W7NJT4_9BACT|nr:DNA methyltransferase [Breznakibacter xylanolyticus]PZX20120.1 type II restriction/modification system DNA methylase subunit YeeA [Breznakibacter xylanolyticus]
MNIAQIEENLQTVIKSFSKESFIFDLLLAYGSPKASISRLQNGNLNLSKIDGEISWKKKVFFRPVENADLHNEISELANQLKHEQRFAIVTDFKTLLAIDTKTQDKLDIELNELPKHFDFFLPLAGMEKAQHANENPADVKAAGKMAKLFDEIKKDNPDSSPEFIHEMNVFLSRLLFCFFAEDTNIFAEGQFTNAIDSHTQPDGSDLHTYLNKLFEVLNTPENNRNNLPAYLQAFPYVNGGLFRPPYQTPNFSRRSRQAIIDSGELQWKEINPDIFGSMFQAVVSVDQRGNLGQHYTSVPNIMKVIEPLFLNDLYEEFEKALQTQNAASRLKLLNALLLRISKIKIFDPACGSGNFLIIAYKELRRLEMKILKELGILAFSNIHLSNFYGIEIDDFAHEIAKLALWLAEHQMNVEFYNQFGRTNPTLPLRDAGNIALGNACRLDWEQVCPKQEGDEIYILGNPPYLGSRNQNELQKNDSKLNFSKDYKSLDYIANWFYKSSNYIDGIDAQYAFVSTNSICQGEQVALLWPRLLKEKKEICFAFQSFKWENNAKSQAAVMVVIIGVRNKSSKQKYLFAQNNIITTKVINPYLSTGSSVFITRHSSPISNLPALVYGSMPNDGGNLIFTTEEKNELINSYPDAEQFVKRFLGAHDFLNGGERWCLYLEENEVSLVMNIPTIQNRLLKVKEIRAKSTEQSTRLLAEKPYKYYFSAHRKTDSIIIPRHSSERREYIPIGFLTDKTLIADSALAIYDATPYIFSIITSRLHMTWVKTVGGRLKTDYRYSGSLCYNTFPFPSISDKQKEELTQCTMRILEEREKHSEKTLAQLYDPDKMPEGLREAHRLNDLAVERCYRSKPFESDEERLEYLFKLYEQMIEEEKNKGTLFAEESKTKKKKK